MNLVREYTEKIVKFKRKLQLKITLKGGYVITVVYILKGGDWDVSNKQPDTYICGAPRGIENL